MSIREMRRKDRLLPYDETVEILRKGEYGVLATVCEDGMPYSIPISYAYDEDGNVIYMHCSNEGGQKIDNIRNSGKACLTVVLNTELMPDKFATKYWSANALGVVRIVDDAGEKRRGIEAILRKYAAAFEEKGMAYIDGAIDRIYVLALEVEQLSGKARKK